MGRDVEKVSPTRDPLATAILMLLIGIVLIVLESRAISILVVFAGVMLMIYGSSSLSKGIRSRDGGSSDIFVGALLAIVGLLLVVATGEMQSILTILVGIFLMLLGVMAIVSNTDAGTRRRNTAIIVGVLMVVIGLVLIIYRGAATDTMMLVIGIVMVLLSSLSLYTYLR